MPWNILTTKEPLVRLSSRGAPNVFVERTVPTGVNQIPGRRPSLAQYGQRQILAGKFTKVLSINQFMQMVTAGITAPTSAPTLASGGAGALTGAMIGYISFAHYYGTTLIHESSLSSGSTTFNASANDIDWSAIQATSTDPRVTHVHLYRSVDGAEPRYIGSKVALGTTTFAGDNVATSALGAVGSTNNGVPPYTRFVEKYHDRIWYAGDPAFPDRGWFSEIGVPEGVGALSFVRTRDGEAITGLKRRGDQLLFFGRDVTYDLQGYTETDFNMRKVTSQFGCVSHHGMMWRGELIVFPSTKGLILYDGARFLPITDHDLLTYWQDDYLANVDRYNDSSGAHDPVEDCFRLLIKRSASESERSFYYIGDCGGIEEGKPVRWEFDKRTRVDNVVGTIDSGSGRIESYTGSCDGFIRKENVESDADDDGDTYQKLMVVESRHDFFEDVGGGTEHAKSYKDYNLFLEHEGQAATVKVYGGMEKASTALTPDQTLTFPAQAQTFGTETMVPRGEDVAPELAVNGQGITRRVEVSAPLDVRFRGDVVAWIPGIDPRSRKT